MSTDWPDYDGHRVHAGVQARKAQRKRRGYRRFWRRLFRMWTRSRPATSKGGNRP